MVIISTNGKKTLEQIRLQVCPLRLMSIFPRPFSACWRWKLLLSSCRGQNCDNVGQPWISERRKNRARGAYASLLQRDALCFSARVLVAVIVGSTDFKQNLRNVPRSFKLLQAAGNLKSVGEVTAVGSSRDTSRARPIKLFSSNIPARLKCSGIWQSKQPAVFFWRERENERDRKWKVSCDKLLLLLCYIKYWLHDVLS